MNVDDMLQHEALEYELNGHLNAVWGESFVVKPRRSRPNKTAVVDHSRPEQVLCGMFTRRSVRDDFNPSALSTRGLKFIDLAQREPVLEFRAADLPYQLRQGDVLVRCKNGVEYDVTDAAPNGHGIVWCKMVERGVSPNSAVAEGVNR